MKQFGWGGVVASEGLPKCPMGRLEREPLHIKPFREQLFKSVHFRQSFTREIKFSGSGLTLSFRSNAKKEGCFFFSLGKGSPLKMERKDMTFAIRRRTPHPRMALFPGHLLTLFLSFAIESFMYETDFTLGPNKEYY